MFTLRLIANICICLCCGFGFFYGFNRCYGKDCPLYIKAVTGAMGCMTSGRLFSVVLQIAGGQTVTRMNLGYLGVAGCFLFLYSANHGEIRTCLGKFRNRAASAVCLIAPIPILLLVYLIIRSEASVQYKQLGVVVALAVFFNAIYLFLFLVLPDSGNGFLRALRPYSLAALVFSYSQLGEIYFSIRQSAVMLIVTYAVLCLSGIVTVPLLVNRVAAWEKKEEANG